MTNDQNPKNDQNRMPKPASRPSDAMGHWCLGFLWSFDIGLLSFAGRGRIPTRDALPQAHLDTVVQLAQAAGGDTFAGFESGEDLLASVLHATDFDSMGAGDT